MLRVPGLQLPGRYRPPGAAPVAVVAVMNLPAGWIVLAAVLALLLGLWLMRAGRGMRLRRGLREGQTFSLDRKALTSRRYGLTGRPELPITTRPSPGNSEEVRLALPGANARPA